MAIYTNTKVPKSLQVNQNTSTTRHKTSGEELYMLSSSLTVIQNNTALTEGNENSSFYSNLGTGFNGAVKTTVTQDDGRIVVGGGFTNLNGNTRNFLVRLNPDGTEDERFYTNLGDSFNSTLYALAVQPDGGILVGGGFTELNGNTRSRLVRLNDIEDATFYNNLGNGFNNLVYALTIQPDGKILVGGEFTELDGNTRNYLVRLNPDGTEDTAFYSSLGGGFNGAVRDITLQPDGGLLVGGAFTDLNGNTRNRLVRLNPDGTEDVDFYTNLGTSFSNKSAVFSIAVQPDGKILIGGAFDLFNGNTRDYLIRLNPDGTEDVDFYTNLGGSFDNIVYSLAIQPDGKILVGGEFQNFNGNTRNRLVQLFSTGEEDTSFYSNLGSGFNNIVWSISNDKILLVGGDFDELDGNTRKHLVDLTSKVFNINTTTTNASNPFEKINLSGVTQINRYSTPGSDIQAGIAYNPTLYYEGVNGELAYWGTGNVEKGVLYNLRGGGDWGVVNVTDPGKGTKLLAIAAGTGRAYEVGMLLRGHARFPDIGCYTGPNTGVPLFLSTTAGEFTDTAPTGTGEIVRIIGYMQNSTTSQIYFCPDNTWVENI